MHTRLPVTIDPFQLASKGERLEGPIAIKTLTRLAPSLRDTTGEIQVTLEFGLDELRQPMVQGSLSGSLTMMCQRCLEPMVQDIDSRFLLGLVKNEYQMNRLSEEYEPLLVTESPIALASIIEDEILLSLPIVATHAPGDCRLVVAATGMDSVEVDTETKPNPFAVLKSLKKT